MQTPKTRKPNRYTDPPDIKIPRKYSLHIIIFRLQRHTDTIYIYKDPTEIHSPETCIHHIPTFTTCILNLEIYIPHKHTHHTDIQTPKTQTYISHKHILHRHTDSPDMHTPQIYHPYKTNRPHKNIAYIQTTPTDIQPPHKYRPHRQTDSTDKHIFIDIQTPQAYRPYTAIQPYIPRAPT